MGFSAGKNLQNNINVDEAQTLSNKTLDSTTVVEAGATIQNPEIIDPNRVDVKKDTLANLETYALTASNGQLVYATDSKQMFQVLDAELTQIGSGGSSGNLLSEIERLTPTVSNVVAVTDNVTFLPVDDNNKSVKATFSGSDGFIRYEAPASADLDGVQGAAIVWIKTSVENLEIYATKDGVAETGSLQIIANNKWRQYEIPIVLGDADYGFEIKASGAVSGDVFIDEAFVKVQRVVKELGQAQFVGSLTYNTASNCIWSNASATMSSFAADTDCNSTTAIGNVSAPNTAIPAVKIPNARTDGYYRISAQGFFYLDGGNNAEFQLSDGTNAGGFSVANNLAESRVAGMIEHSFRFTSAGDKQIEIQTAVVAGTSQIYANTLNRKLEFTVHFYPDANSTIVAQDTELNNKQINTLHVRPVYNTAASPSTIEDQFGLIDSYGFSSPYGIVRIKKEFYSEAPIISCNLGMDGSFNNNELVLCSRSSGDDTATGYGYRVFVFRTSGVYIARVINMYFTRNGTDYNKSATIVGKFENINSSDLVKVLARGNDGTGITGNSTPINFTETEDNLNTWDGSRFTAPKDSYYFFNGKVRVTTSISALKIFINGSDDGFIGYEGNTSDMVQFTAIRRMSKNEYAEIVSDSTATLSNLPLAHSLEITELPDTESIIKNLSQQKTLCQTKTTSVEYTSDGATTQLDFNNLTIGKKYSVNAFYPLTLAASDSFVQTNVFNGELLSTNVCYTWDGNGGTVVNSSTTCTNTFTAIDTIIRTSVQALNTGSKIHIGARIELCELPDTVVETTKFD